ncbi:DEAD/DEAH box helicase [Nonomuraea sp. PA05]|uniref:DEAD/DEAH box helicase n=1 Tax=Nonomuraea sp. PA05 TaxID=2604466 RepID=UPI0011D73CCD|nr:DEAD/DEAH box helicase [Nonomuraea sp. PA05]TYB68800.1 DEAD/DEAH box helicase [Nonomuraea sp. PA05]
MLVHGVWTAEGLAFWAETTPPAPSPASGRVRPGGTGRAGSGAAAHPHPFAAPATAVAAALALDTPPAPPPLAPPPLAPNDPLDGPLDGPPPPAPGVTPGHAGRAAEPRFATRAPEPPDAAHALAAPDAAHALAAPDAAHTLAAHAEPSHTERAAEPSLTGRAPETRLLELLLPGSAREPLPSPETGRMADVARPRLRLWQVPAVIPPTPATLRVLTDHAATATTRHWAAVAAFAHDLVRRGRVIPQLVLNPAPAPTTSANAHPDPTAMWAPPANNARAVWRPVLTGADAAYFRDLALAMPPACRTSSAERPSADVQREALEEFTDALVRRALTTPLLTRPPRTPQDHWLAALSGDATTTSCPDVPDLRRELERWHEAVATSEGATRLCFRLLEPSDDDDWRVELALQAADDPSLYVPAEQVWGGVTGLPGKPERELLTGLGRAVRLYPELDRALRVPEPSELALDTAGAFGFLRRAAPLLQAAGFGVQLPRWAGRTRLGLKLTTRTTKRQSAAASQGFGMRELVDFRVDLAVGDETISEAELAELARLKVPLVRVRGQWVELDDRQLKAALRAVEGSRAGQADAAEILRRVVGSDDEVLPLLEVDADGVLGDLLSGQAERRLAPLATPPGLDATLRPYQERGLAWLSFLSELGLGGVLADDMGLGKTITTLALLVHERADAPTLLVCPMSLIGNWQREAARFAPGLRVYVHHGSGRDAAEIASADLVITTYGTAARDLETLKEHPWRRVVCDEAQAIKNSGTLQAQAVRSIPTGTRLALTGTPVENHLAELWSIMEFANPGMLGPRSRFRTRFQEPIEARQDEQAASALKRATGPFILRRLKTDKSIISDLPEKLEVKEWCPLTTEQASLYQAVVDDMLAKIDSSEGIERRGLVLAAMAKLKQVCNHPAHLLKDGSRLAGRSGKLTRLEQLAEEILAEGEKALLFTQYAEFGAMLQPYLAQRLDRPVLWLHGGLPKKTRDRLVDRFQHDEEPTLFVLSLKAAGVGLNLTAANHVIHVDRWWNPAVEDQATDRAFRIGQRKNVQVRKLICAGTLEERVDQMIERKKALAERVVGTGEEWLTDLSTEELREVFRLTTEGVG